MMLSLSALPADAEAGWPLRRLVERAGLRDAGLRRGGAGKAAGANTPEEREQLTGR